MKRKIIGTAYFGGEEGIKTILNNYYEDAIRGFQENDQIKVRTFIEEGLLYGKRRIGMVEDMAEKEHGIRGEIREKLLDSRLIRSEVSSLGKSYEISHDAMVPPILKSREKRREKEERQRREAELREIKRRNARLIGLVLLGFLLAAISIGSTIYAIKQNRELQEQKQEAEEAKIETQEHLNKLNDTIFISYRDRYYHHIDQGEVKMEVPDYEAAANEFLSALIVIDDYAQRHSKSRADSIDNGGHKADSLLQIAKSRGNLKEQFDQLIQEAEDLEEKGDKYLVDAKNKYLQAKILGYDDALVQSKLDLLKGRLQSAFVKFKELGDNFLDATANPDAWKIALEFYIQAGRIRPNDEYINKRIEECRRNI